ncbi:rCG52574, isoform CRA_a [Rattus norvegicus]|uniref:RCG52574, isoform CRA_a n=1 Tax=Rattus norvegicus TaxID=10116 RepID=A6IRN2_RAT|nr:rCG52574, isoform CRA_a [Rattus norvegicus]
MSQRKKKQNYNEVTLYCTHSLCSFYHSEFRHYREKGFSLLCEVCCANIVLRVLT